MMSIQHAVFGLAGLLTLGLTGCDSGPNGESDASSSDSSGDSGTSAGAGESTGAQTGMPGGTSGGVTGTSSGTDGTSSSSSSSSSSGEAESSSTGEAESSGTGAESSGSTGEPPIAPICPNIIDAWDTCDIQGPYDEEGCEFHMGQHPGVGAPEDCTDAIRDRLDCYAMQDCETLESCSLWGCSIEDPCPVEQAAVEAACERTPCEQHWDATIACGLPQGVTQPGYCEYVKALNGLFVDDYDACAASYDARAACFAQLDCEALASCQPTLDNACMSDGMVACAPEQAQFELDC